jgi:hypothetical protein
MRPFLGRLRGVEIRNRVFIGDDVYLENEYLDGSAPEKLLPVMITNAIGKRPLPVHSDVLADGMHTDTLEYVA